MALPKWTEDRTAALQAYVGDASPVTQDVVAEAAEHFETSTRSVSSKLRKMGFEVQLASANASKAFSDEAEAELRSFVENNSGAFTYAEIAEQFQGGTFSAKQIQGKLLSMELTGAVKPTPKAAAVRTYTSEEEAQFVQMAQAGNFVEEIAEAMNRSVQSVRGKALSLLRAGVINSIPATRDVKEAAADPLEALGDLSSLTVDQIAESIDKSPRGVKTMLTRRGLVAADYNGAAKREKADSASA